MLILLASGYDETFEPVGGWDEAREEGRAIVLAGEEILIAEIPSILSDAEWAIPVINYVRRSQNYGNGNPYGANVGWPDWDAAYLEILEAIENADEALKERK